MKKITATFILIVMTTVSQAQVKLNKKIKTPISTKIGLKTTTNNKLGRTSIIEINIYSNYLNNELLKVAAEKKSLLVKIKNGDKGAELQLKNLYIKEKVLKNKLQIATNIRNRVLKDFPKPRPVPPCPTFTDCRLEVLEDIWVDKTVKSIKIVVLDTSKKVIGKLNNKSVFTDSKTGLSKYLFKVNDSFKGDVILFVTRNTTNGTENYTQNISLK